MSITFKGNTPDYLYWVFDIDGKTFVARNSSSQSPLRIRFTDGRFFGTYSISQIIPGATLVKNTGFDIITGTSQDIDQAGIVKTGIVEWTWAGQKYRNRWNLIEGTELSAAIPEEGVVATFAYDLDIAPPYAPYDGPAGGTVGTGVASPAVVQAMTKDDREAKGIVETTQITPAAQLSTAAPVQQSPAPAPATTTAPPQVGTGISVPGMTKDDREAKEAAAVAQISPAAQAAAAQEPAKVTTAPPQVGTGVSVQSNKTKEDIEASTAYKTYAYSNQTPVRTSVPQTPAPQAPVGITQSPVIIPGTKDAREAAAAAAGSDWVKLALQVGAAYLLLS